MIVFLDANGNKFILPKKEKVFWRISGYVLIEKGNKLLVVVPRWNDLYELPGGGIEESESIKEGIIRECWEETGYKVKIENDLPCYFSEQNFYHRHQRVFYHSLVVVYQGRLLSGEQDKTVINTADGDEISKVIWRKLSEFTADNTHWIIYPAIEKLKIRNKILLP